MSYVDPVHRVDMACMRKVFESPMIGHAWGWSPMYPYEIRKRISENKLDSRSWGWGGNEKLAGFGNEKRDYHLQRIAYLVVNPDTKPVEVEMGIDTWLEQAALTDGNHRYAAAIIRGDKTIDVIFGGFIDKLLELFPSAHLINPKKMC